MDDSTFRTTCNAQGHSTNNEGITVKPGWIRCTLGLCILLASFLTGCTPPPGAVAHEVYVWQRQWTPAVSATIEAHTRLFDAFRVLALEVTGREVYVTTPDLLALAATEKSVRMVVRMEGSRVPIDVERLLGALEPGIAKWQAAGVIVSGIEIDHDCASAALRQYAQWLRDLRARLPDALPLSITALPSWLESTDLPSLLAIVDHSVLQVHGVERNRPTLFESKRARAWVRDWSTKSDHPFLVALPAYGVYVSKDAGGRVVSVDAEAGRVRSSHDGSELRADAADVASFLRAIERRRPARLSGVIWFRLPVPGDRRSWSMTMLESVITRQPLRSDWQVQTELQPEGHLEIYLSNMGTLDARPPLVLVPESCPIADAAGMYRLDPQNLHHLMPDDRAWLRAGHRMHIGWARCPNLKANDWKSI